MYSDKDDLTAGFPHSEIHGSKLAHSSPRLIAACHVLHRLCAPRHPPDALKTLDYSHYHCPPRSAEAIRPGNDNVEIRQSFNLPDHASFYWSENLWVEACADLACNKAIADPALLNRRRWRERHDNLTAGCAGIG